MLADNSSNLYRNSSVCNNGLSSNIMESLYEFLKEAELQHYFDDLNLKLKVRSTAQLKYVDETDLQSIGMTRPEMRRLKKYFSKEFPQTAMGKIKKKLSRTSSSRSTSVPRPEDLSNRMSSFTSRIHSNGLSISPMDSDELTTIASVTNFSITSNGTSDSYDWRQSGSKHLILHNQLTVGSILRHGDFADIYKGIFRPSQVQIQVAVKVINKVTLKSDFNDFVREIFTNCYLDHPNITKLYGICLDDYSIKMAIELTNLGSLVDCLIEQDSKTKYPIPTLHSVVVQVSDAMSFLEERRVIHGRLTCRNVLIFPDNKAKVTDAGLFRAYSTVDKNDTSDPCLWLSPEVSKGYKETVNSDVWAFGVLLWEIYSYCQHSPPSLMDESMSSQMDMRLPYLSQPDLCPNMIFQLMKECWIDLPKDRPSFYQLSSQLVRLEPEQVVALVDGPDLIPSHRSEEANEPSDDSYSSLTEMQMLYYSTNDTIVVLDRSMNQYKELWRGCLLNGECGYFKWSNMRALGVADVLQPPKKKANQPSPVVSIKSSGHSIGEAFSKIHISRREDKKKQGKLSIDMIGSPENDFRHVGHVGANGDVFGDVTSLYASPAQQKARSGSVSISSKSEHSTSFSEISSVISSNTLNAQAGEDTPPYATIDSGPKTIQSNKSKESSTKIIKKDNKPVAAAPPLPPVRSHSEEEANVYLDDLTIGNNYFMGNESFSLFDELSKQWEMQSSKIESPTSETKVDPKITYESLSRKSPISNEDYSEVYEDTQRSNSTYLPVNNIIETPKPLNCKTQRSASVMVQPTSNGSNTAKSNIFQKFLVFGSGKSSKSKDSAESPVYAKVGKQSKSKKEKEKEVSDKKKNIISRPILISGPAVNADEYVVDNYLDCSSEVSSLQPSPRDSVLCLINTGLNSNGVIDPSPSFNRQHSNITNNSRGKTSDSTVTSVSPASSFASLTSTPASSVLQGGAALRALRKGDGVFRAPSAVNAFNRKRPSIGQIQFDPCINEGTMFRTRQPSLPLTSNAVKISSSTIERRNPLNHIVDNYEQLDGVMDSSATTPVASELPELPYVELSFVRPVVQEKVNHGEEEDAYNSLHSGSLGSDTIEPRSFSRKSDFMYDRHDSNNKNTVIHNSLNSSIKDEFDPSVNKMKFNERPKTTNNTIYSYNYPNNSNIFNTNGEDDEVAL